MLTVKQLKQLNRFSREEFAEKAGVHLNTMNAWINEKKNPKLSDYQKLLRITAEHLDLEATVFIYKVIHNVSDFEFKDTDGNMVEFTVEDMLKHLKYLDEEDCFTKSFKEKFIQTSSLPQIDADKISDEISGDSQVDFACRSFCVIRDYDGAFYSFFENTWSDSTGWDTLAEKVNNLEKGHGWRVKTALEYMIETDDVRSLEDNETESMSFKHFCLEFVPKSFFDWY